VKPTFQPQCHLGAPRITANEWSLSADGLVRRRMRLTLRHLDGLARAKITSIHECCGSPLKPSEPMRRTCNVTWTGARLAELLAECDVDPAAQYVWSSGADYCHFEGDACEAFVKDLPANSLDEAQLPGYALLVDFGLDEAGEVSQRILPAEIARFHRNDVGKAFLHDVHVSADGDGLERYRHLDFARQIGIVECVRVAQTLAGHELQILSTEGMALARGEIAE
jgi:hypothetical protein